MLMMVRLSAREGLCCFGINSTGHPRMSSIKHNWWCSTQSVFNNWWLKIIALGFRSPSKGNKLKPGTQVGCNKTAADRIYHLWISKLLKWVRIILHVNIFLKKYSQVNIFLKKGWFFKQEFQTYSWICSTLEKWKTTEWFWCKFSNTKVIFKSLNKRTIGLLCKNICTRIWVFFKISAGPIFSLLNSRSRSWRWKICDWDNVRTSWDSDIFLEPLYYFFSKLFLLFFWQQRNYPESMIWSDPFPVEEVFISFIKRGQGRQTKMNFSKVRE